MWSHGNIEIPTFELDSSIVRLDRGFVGSTLTTSPALVSTNTLSFGPLEFLDAMTRTKLVDEPSFMERLFHGFFHVYDLRNILIRTRQGTLRFDSDGRDRVRDDERTTVSKRIGHALTYLLGMKIRNHRHIVDFGKACEEHYGVTAPVSNEPRPDFVGSGNGFASGEILESKGHLLAPGRVLSWKTDLKEALRDQVDAGLVRLQGTTVQRGWAVSTVLRERRDSHDSAIAYSDPVRDDLRTRPPSPSRRHRMVDLHYAVWAATVGQRELTRLLLGESGGNLVIVQGDEVEWMKKRWFIPRSDCPLVPAGIWAGGLELELAERLGNDQDLFTDYVWPRTLEREEGVILRDASALVSTLSSKHMRSREIVFRRSRNRRRV